MGIPVRRVLCRQFRRPNDQQILGVVLLGVLREVEAAGDDRIAILHACCLARRSLGGCRFRRAGGHRQEQDGKNDEGKTIHAVIVPRLGVGIKPHLDRSWAKC